MSTDAAEFFRRRRRRGAARTSKQRACIDKHTYGRRAARRAARILRREHGEHVHAYPCPWGSHWHVGHTAHEDLAW